MSSNHIQALADAVLSRNTAALRAAIAGGADPNTPLHGNHPLHLAVMAGSRPNVDLLLENRANPNAKDNAGRAPLHYAALGSPDADSGLVSSLVNAGADPNAQDSRGATPLDLASGAGNKEAAVELVRVGAKCRPDRKEWVQRVTSAGQSVGPRGGP